MFNESEFEKLKKILSEIGTPFEIGLAAQELKIVYNLPPLHRYEADQVIKLAGSVLFFDHTGRFIGLGSLCNKNKEMMELGKYQERQ